MPGCTSPLFVQYPEGRCFNFVRLIGYLWQMVYQSQAIYDDAGFCGEIAVWVNLVGTTGTCLIGFAHEWVASPTIYQDYRPNIRIRQRLPLASASDDEIEIMIRKIARDLGVYYGQDRPRCFDCRTGEFPHKDYTGR